MEIKTKFNVGDKVWYVAYDNIAYDCPHCGEKYYNEKPCGVKQCDIDDIYIMHSISYQEERYKVIAERHDNGICIYTNRQADRVYATEEEAQKAYADELAEYYDNKRIEKQRLIEWINSHYEEIPTED